MPRIFAALRAFARGLPKRARARLHGAQKQRCLLCFPCFLTLVRWDKGRREFAPCHPEPCEGTLLEYCQDLNRDPSASLRFAQDDKEERPIGVVPSLSRDLSRMRCKLYAVNRQHRLHTAIVRNCSDPFEGVRSFTLLARGKTSAPQSAAYGRMPMATCCGKRQLFRRRLLQGNCVAFPLRVT